MCTRSPLKSFCAGVPGKEDDDAELDVLAGRLVVEPVGLVGCGDVCFLADALRADHDVGELKVDVGERAEQAAVEPSCPFVSVPDVLGADDLVDAVVGEGREEASDVPLVLGDRVPLPELADLVVLGGINGESKEFANVAHVP